MYVICFEPLKVLFIIKYRLLPLNILSDIISLQLSEEAAWSFVCNGHCLTRIYLALWTQTARSFPSGLSEGCPEVEPGRLTLEGLEREVGL